MRTDSTPRLLAIYHDGSFLPPLPLHGPTLICIFMKPNTNPPPPLPLIAFWLVENLNLNSNLNFYLFYSGSARQEEGGEEGLQLLLRPHAASGAIAERSGLEWSTCCAWAGV